MWALASLSKCRQRPLSWASTSKFLQPSFLASSSTPSIHLDFGQPRPHWPPGFVLIIFLGNLFSSILSMEYRLRNWIFFWSLGEKEVKYLLGGCLHNFLAWRQQQIQFLKHYFLVCLLVVTHIGTKSRYPVILRVMQKKPWEFIFNHIISYHIISYIMSYHIIS